MPARLALISPRQSDGQVARYAPPGSGLLFVRPRAYAAFKRAQGRRFDTAMIARRRQTILRATLLRRADGLSHARNACLLKQALGGITAAEATKAACRISATRFDGLPRAKFYTHYRSRLPHARHDYARMPPPLIRRPYEMCTRHR